VWQWAFDGVSYDEPIIVQHLITGICAHIVHDLGIATAAVGKDGLADLERDFDYVNVILASQVKPVLTALAEMSPNIGKLLALPLDDEALVARLIVAFRNLAWKYATVIAEKPDRLRELVDLQDAWASVLSTLVIHPPNRLPRLVSWIRDAESRDIADNVRRFDDAAQIPVAVNPIFLQALTV
jgi:hypothetical protein